MSRWSNPDGAMRYLNATEREQRQRYHAAHPDLPEELATTANWAPIADWLAAQEAESAELDVQLDAEVGEQHQVPSLG
jgi:hypothetical protein